MQTSTTNFYDILGIESSASLDEIRRAYKSKALETHPDKQDIDATAEEKQIAKARFHKVQEAFQTLNDPEQRKTYDALMNYKIRYDRSRFSEAQLKRDKAREEWAQQADSRLQTRLKLIRTQSERTRDALKTQKERDYAALADRMFHELCELNPEWEERKRSAESRKLEQSRMVPLKQKSMV